MLSQLLNVNVVRLFYIKNAKTRIEKTLLVVKIILIAYCFQVFLFRSQYNFSTHLSLLFKQKNRLLCIKALYHSVKIFNRHTTFKGLIQYKLIVIVFYSFSTFIKARTISFNATYNEFIFHRQRTSVRALRSSATPILKHFNARTEV